MFSLSRLFRPSFTQTRLRSQLAPRQVKYIKRHKGVIPIPIGGSTSGTTLTSSAQWGIRIKSTGVRLTAKQLTTAEDVIKRKLKDVVKGGKVWLRVFPDIPVCIKGNETRMGKGKGTFEFWATRVPVGRVIFEIGGKDIREELARDILRQAASKLPTKMEFISRDTPPRLGNLVLYPPKPVKRIAEESVPSVDHGQIAGALATQPTTSSKTTNI
ncbi:MAG: ribosomal protein L16p/L10e-domain-containing protein [Lentinula lateritia]|uniref:Ribosomal protein L16p/L10e-domain-containing protein n=1 Tax=Lentinula lateritia TaxID=40482 RepID=A0ABQ8VPS8_9AGAR|nr:ribosomal protein L16p/L10e-domain-containing protein [Lentinula novae-zelandiae]KAJ3928692.1 MAG: ribosomal protein L16p/L10e-domain-containing protein [Lentinula lateritia]KAJ4498403.1 ribosomal protein L16p/L10e-domain-containing protein [Lentinula lateritia]